MAGGAVVDKIIARPAVVTESFGNYSLFDNELFSIEVGSWPMSWKKGLLDHVENLLVRL